MPYFIEGMIKIKKQNPHFCLADPNKKKSNITKTTRHHTRIEQVSVDVHRYNYTKDVADEGGQQRKIDRYYAHPHYNAKQISNDIALIHLSESVQH